MSLKETLQTNNISIDYNYYGLSDMATYFELDSLLSKLPIVFDFLDNFSLSELSSFEDLKDFFLVNKISQFSELKDKVKPDYRQDFEHLLEKANSIQAKFSNGDIIKCINRSYQDFFIEEYDFSLYQLIFDKMILFQSGISEEVFIEFAKKKQYLILNNFAKLGNLKHNKNLFDVLFPASFCLQTAKNIGLGRVFSIFGNILSDYNSPFNHEIHDFINLIIDEELEVLGNLQYIKDNILFFESEYRTILHFLKKIKHPRTFEIQKYQKNIEIATNEHLSKHGQSFSFSISTAETMSALKKEDNWRTQMLLLTHDKISKKFISVLSCESEGKQSIIDYITSNIPTDEYFTMSHQQLLKVIFINGAAIIQSIWHDPDLHLSLKDWYITILESVDKSIGNEEKLPDDINIIFSLLDKILLEPEQSPDLMTGYSYGASMFICGMLEKLLRLVFIDINENKRVYVPIESMQLGSLLKSQEIKDMLGENHAKNIFFYLGKNENEIGYNIRNSLAHLNDTILQVTNPLLACGLFYIYTDILNSIMLYLYYSSNYEPPIKN